MAAARAAVIDSGGYSRGRSEEAGNRLPVLRDHCWLAAYCRDLGGTEPSRTRASLEALLGERVVVVFLAVSWFVDGGVFPEIVDGGGATLGA